MYNATAARKEVIYYSSAERQPALDCSKRNLVRKNISCYQENNGSPGSAVSIPGAGCLALKLWKQTDQSTHHISNPLLWLLPGRPSAILVLWHCPKAEEVEWIATSFTSCWRNWGAKKGCAGEGEGVCRGVLCFTPTAMGKDHTLSAVLWEGSLEKGNKLTLQTVIPELSPHSFSSWKKSSRYSKCQEENILKNLPNLEKTPNHRLFKRIQKELWQWEPSTSPEKQS